MKNQGLIIKNLSWILFVLLYFATGKLGLILHSVNDLASLIWIPTGLSLAWVITYGTKAWPPITLGAFLVNLHMGAPPLAALCIAGGNTLESLLAGHLIQKFKVQQLSRIRDFLHFCFVAVPLGTLVSSLLGTFSILLIHAQSPHFLTLHQAGITWLTWWAGNMSGALLITPAILAWSTPALRPFSKKRVLEFALLTLFLILVCKKIFFGHLFHIEAFFVLALSTVPFILWAAFRFSLRGSTLTTLLISAMAIAGTIQGLGPLGKKSLYEALLFLEFFILLIALSGMMLNAAITEELLAGQTLRVQKELQEYIDNMATFIAKIDPYGKLLLLNQRALKAINIPPEKIRTLNLFDPSWGKIDQEVQKRIVEAFKMALQGEPISYEEWIQIDSSEKIPINLSLTPVFDHEQRVSYILAEAQNLTQQKQTEKLLLQKEAQLLEAQKLAHIGSWEWNMETNEASWSEELYRIFKREIKKEKITIQDYYSYLHPDDLLMVKGKIEESLQKSIPFHNKAKVILPNNEIRFLDTRGQVIKDKSGKIIGLLGICQDITEVQQAELERHRLYLFEQKARQEAEELNRAKDTFLAILSHELRTPLATILSWSQVLQSKELEKEKFQKGLGVIEQSAKIQEKMITNLLDISRMVMGKLALDWEEIDPNQAVLEAVESLRNDADDKGLTLQLELQENCGLISADPLRLKQILWNLLTNAFKFTPAGGVVTIKVAPYFVLKTPWVRIQITDTGKGISLESQKHIFDLFTQIHDPKVKGPGGLGLGLAIAQKLTELHLGKIRVESDGPDKGSTFILEFPLIKVQTTT